MQISESPQMQNEIDPMEFEFLVEEINKYIEL